MPGVPGFEISSDPSRLDLDVIHGFLSTSYWAQGRTRDTVERAIRNSICVAIYNGARQAAFGRIVTDRAVFAYLADIFVLPEYRGHGLGKALVRAMLITPTFAGCQRCCSAPGTRTACTRSSALNPPCVPKS